MEATVLGISIHITDDAWLELRDFGNTSKLSENAVRALSTALAELTPSQLMTLGGINEKLIVAKAVAMVAQWRRENNAQQMEAKLAAARERAADNEARAAYLNAKSRGIVD